MNLIALCAGHYHQSSDFTHAMDIIEIALTTYFALEALVKIVGLSWHYFRSAWNIFDFIILVFSILGKSGSPGKNFSVVYGCS